VVRISRDILFQHAAAGSDDINLFKQFCILSAAVFSPQTSKEAAMITRFHGIDKHKKYSTISLLNRKGEEVDFRQKCYDLKEYIENLGSEEVVKLLISIKGITSLMALVFLADIGNSEQFKK
jgi:hypothetical protein